MDVDPVTAPDLSRARRGREDVLAVFAVMWAAATLFHVWGPSGRAFAVLSDPSTIGVTQALAGAVALLILLRPRNLALLVALAVLGLVTLWFEMPVAGSHWVVAALVDVALLLAVLATRGRDRFVAAFLPLARIVLVGFYAFAAFAKLNRAFFTPEVSCGTYYLDELAGSLGFTLQTQAGGGWSHLVPFAVAGTELSIPLLLTLRRTRTLGVVIALAFHSLIALDQTHLFSDFSSVLAALFVLFLPAGFASDVVGRFRRLDASRREAVRVAAFAVCAVVQLAQWYGEGAGIERLFVDGRAWAWVLYDAIVLALVGWYLWRRRPAPIVRPFAFAREGAPRWLLIVPALVLLTGLSPYLELRTAYAFNMYSNLETADGESNHFLVTRTLPLVDHQSDLVRIVRTSDPGLRLYVSERYDLPYLQLQDYLSRHRDVAITYVRGGVEHQLDRASDEPDLVEPVPSWKAKFFAYRSLDQTEPARCQPAFLPAL